MTLKVVFTANVVTPREHTLYNWRAILNEMVQPESSAGEIITEINVEKIKVHNTIPIIPGI